MKALLLALGVVLFASCGPVGGRCTPTNCPNGCCDEDGECQSGREQNACGNGAGACSACSFGTSCQLGECISWISGGGPGVDGGFILGGGAGGGSGGGGGAGGGAGGGSTSCDGTISGSREAQVCHAFRCARDNMSEGNWVGGNVASCVPGDMDNPGRANALRLLNAYRFVAQLPQVVTDPELNAKAQACALMMDANNALSHHPPTSWLCYTADGDEAAASSNISSGRGVRSIDMYMSDYGASNALSLGHRRWFLSNSLGPVGIGSTSDSSCHWVIGGAGDAGRKWAAWPPAGPVPMSGLDFGPGFIEPIDATGWSVQSDTIALTNGAGDSTTAQVLVTDDGAVMPVTVYPLLRHYGSAYAIRFTPQGWTTQPGRTYHVEITNISEPIIYDVQPVDCP